MTTATIQKKTASYKSLKMLSSPKYKGKHLIIVKNKVFTAKTGQEAARIFKEVIKRYPKEKPTITYVPKENMLILFVGL